MTGTVGALLPNTTYFYRLVATNGQGTTNGAVMSFTTGGTPTAPAVLTGTASSIKSNSATLNGTVDPERQQTAFTFEYGTPTQFQNGGTGITAVDDAGSFGGNEAVSLPATGLSSATTYCYRIVASNLTGTSTGALSCFTTG